MSTIAVIGGTGAQGGSVINALLKSNNGWKIRALARNAGSEKAKALQSCGVEAVSADTNDESSLVKAFQGVTAIFAVTTYWESVMTLGRDGAGEEEVEQLKKIFSAASKTPTLQHFVLSALPHADKISGGKLKVPHLDYKQKAFDWMRVNIPDLYAKTSQIWPGWYPSNLATLPMVEFLEIPNTYGGYLFVQPSKPTALLPIAGDINYNFGVVVAVTEYLPMIDVTRVFEEVTGKRAAYAEISDETAAKLYGVYGEEHPRWEDFEADKVISLEELQVKDKLVSFKGALEGLKEQLI